MNQRILAAVEKFKHVIWDWNGTLVDDVEVAVGAVNALLTEHGLPALDAHSYRREFGFPVRKYYEKLGFDFARVPFEKLCDRFAEEYNSKRAKLARLFPDVQPLLESARRGRKQSILSAAAQWHLDEITEHFAIRHHFDHVFGINDHFASSKLGRGRELIAASGVTAAETVLIGDTDHDCEVAGELGIACVLVADGHQTFERLTAVHHHVLEGRGRIAL